MSTDTLIKVEGVSKKFCRNLKTSLWYGMKDLGSEFLGRPAQKDQLRPEEFWAVKDVSFELKRGECLGLIGRNGAGKTTLLRMLNGLIKPDQGHIEMHGRIGALIALGAGFNPILTGRENIYINAAVLGLTRKETDARFEEIVEFADMNKFIDMPVQSYSSGMQVRLGFAISSIITPDILIIDEILAVGDVTFRDKCYQRIGDLVENSAVILVSHDNSSIERLSNKCILLDIGKCVADGRPRDVFIKYKKLTQSNNNNVHTKITTNNNIYDFSITASCSKKKTYALQLIDIVIKIEFYCFHEFKIDLALGNILSSNGQLAGQFDFTESVTSIKKGENIISFSIDNISLSEEEYSLDIVAFINSGKNIAFSVRNFFQFNENYNKRYGTLYAVGTTKT